MVVDTIIIPDVTIGALPPYKDMKSSVLLGYHLILSPVPRTKTYIPILGWYWPLHGVESTTLGDIY